MKKPVTKIICAAVASVVACGIAAFAGCSPYNSIDRLDYTPSDTAAVSNGGFAVEKGDYVYFINGVQSNTAENSYGTPVKGAIMRVSAADLKNRNYASAEMVVPQIAYSGNYDTGIFVYGDYVYYSTPSVTKTSDGTVQNTTLDLKRTRLDGTESMKDSYITFPSLTQDFRFVEDGGTVYIMYVADESLYEESSTVTNLHSLNTATGEDKLLAYNISSYLFDAENKSNPRVYYTMSNFNSTGGEETNYNQLFTVTAGASAEKEYDVSSLIWWDGEANRYINCGDMVFDGIGNTRTATPFSYKPDGSAKNQFDYTYTLESYQGGTLFYTRHSSVNTTGEYLFALKDSDFGASFNPVTGNAKNEDVILLDGSGADGYKYVFDGEDLKCVISASSMEITVNYLKNGKLAEKIDGEQCVRVATGSSITLLFVDGDNLYYSAADNSNNGYTFFRVNYTGEKYRYEGYPDTWEYAYQPVRILDLDASSSWYKPEFIEKTILFPSETTVMTSYNYVMAFNVGDKTNSELRALNKLYEGITGTEGVIGDYGNSDLYPTDVYANLANAARYMFYTGDIDYVKELAAACNAKLDEDDDPVYSDNTLAKLEQILAPKADNDWKDYTATATVNGKTVYACNHDYYYSMLGKMSEDDAESYLDDFKSDYLQSWPEEESVTWWEGLNTVARVFFIIGMCLAGLLVIGGAVLLVVMLLRRRKKTDEPSYAKRRIKVDLTDDGEVNVYGDDPEEDGEDSSESPEE